MLRSGCSLAFAAVALFSTSLKAEDQLRPVPLAQVFYTVDAITDSPDGSIYAVGKAATLNSDGITRDTIVADLTSPDLLNPLPNSAIQNLSNEGFSPVVVASIEPDLNMLGVVGPPSFPSYPAAIFYRLLNGQRALQTLSSLPGTYFSIRKMNASLTVVGALAVASANRAAVSGLNGTVALDGMIAAPGSQGYALNVATDINDSGQIVGQACPIGSYCCAGGTSFSCCNSGSCQTLPRGVQTAFRLTPNSNQYSMERVSSSLFPTLAKELVAINESGVAVGIIGPYLDEPGSAPGGFYIPANQTAAQMITTSVPNSIFLPRGISNTNMVVGVAKDRSSGASTAVRYNIARNTSIKIHDLMPYPDYASIPAFSEVKAISHSGKALLVSGGSCANGSCNYALLRICRADIDGNRQVSIQDVFTFLTRYFTGFPPADYNQDGVIGVQDIFDFLADFFSAHNGVC